MPQIYSRTENRRRTLSNASISSSSSSSTIPLRDVDDSIVLSDLVRTGEASRLRRRGAMRVDHGYHGYPGRLNDSASPNIVVVQRPSWDSDFDQDDTEVFEGHPGRAPSIRYPRPRRHSSRRYGPYASTSTTQQDTDECVYTLVCGAEVASVHSDELEPYRPSILPLYPPTSSSSCSINTKSSNGCGTLIHVKAVPRSRIGLWSARSPATSSVVPLDAEYFESREAAKFVRSSCGCIKEGIGCATCGNPLGMRYIPCKTASDSFFCPRSHNKPSTSSSPCPRGPEGPQYWLPSSAKTSDHTVYTFLSTAVTSSPRYEFPNKPVPRQRTSSNISTNSATLSAIPRPYIRTDFEVEVSEPEDNDQGTWQSAFPQPELAPPHSTMVFDRFSPTSPTPMSDAENEDPPWSHERIHTRSRARRPRINPGSGAGYDDVMFDSSPGSFYQQQVVSAWERERDRVRQNGARRSRGRGFDPDGESYVWGAVDTDISTESQDPDSPDKTTEGFFPDR